MPTSETTKPVSGATTVSYQIERFHARDEGIVAIPIAGPHPQIPCFVRTFAPIEQETIMWVAAREGGPPTIPSWKSFLAQQKAVTPANLNRVFLNGERSGSIPVDSLAGRHFIVIYGTYRYAVINPEGLDSDFYLGVQPWELPTIMQNGIQVPNPNGINPNVVMIPAANFNTGLLGVQPNTPYTTTPPILTLLSGIQT